MYPDRELNRLAVHKAALRRSIALRRVECAAAAAQVAQPLAWLDRMLALWRQFSPLAALASVPLGFLAQRTLFRRSTLLGSLVRWGPLVFNAVRGLGSMFKAPFESARNHD